MSDRLQPTSNTKGKICTAAFEGAAAVPKPVGIITKEIGLTLTRMGTDGVLQTIKPNVGDEVYKNDILTTRPQDGAVAIKMNNNTLLSAGPDSKLDISRHVGPEGDQGQGAGAKKSTFSFISGTPSAAPQQQQSSGSAPLMSYDAPRG